MALNDRKIIVYANPVTSLPDHPSQGGWTAAALKAAFDANATNEIKTSINGIVDDLKSASGANEIGSTPLKEGGASTVGGQLEEIYDEVSPIIPSEATRVSSENTRISNENTRISNENTRLSNESTRVTAENARISAENTRVSNENLRQNTVAAIEANYAPRLTSVENEINNPDYTPVLSRQEPVFSVGTGYDSNNVLQDLSADIIQGQVPVNVKGLSAVNIVKNGNFANGTTGWTAGNSNISVSNNTLVVTGNGNGAYFSVSPSLPKIYNGRKYYLVTIAKVTSAGCTALRIWLGNNQLAKDISNPTQNQLYKLSSVLTATSDYSVPITIESGYINATTANGKVMEVKNVIAIDMGTDANNPLYNKTVTEMDKMFANWFDGIGSVNDVRVKSVGKNLLNQTILDKLVKSYGADGKPVITNGKITRPNDSESDWQGYIKLKPNTTYTFSRASANGILVSIGAWEQTTATTNAQGDLYIEVYCGGANQYVIDAQLEENTIATPYEPYTESISEIPVKLHSLPNGVKDEIVDGKLIKRVAEYTLLASDIELYETSGANIDLVQTKVLSSFNNFKLGSNAIDGQIINTFSQKEIDETSWNNVVNIGAFFLDQYRLQWVVSKGTYANLAAAQTALAGTKILYQLATPVISDLVTPLTVFPNGTISIESDKETTIPQLNLSYPLDMASVVARLNDGVNQLSKITKQQIKDFADYIAPACRVYSTTNQSVPDNGAIVVNFNSERFDTDNIHDLTNPTRLTCKTAGVYVISGCVEFATNATGYRQVGLLLNGTSHIAIQRAPANATSGSNHTVSVSSIFKLEVGDYIELRPSQYSGGALNVVATTNHSPELSMVKVG